MYYDNMRRVEVTVATEALDGYDSQVFKEDTRQFEGSDAFKEANKYFLALMEDKANWLIGASWRPDSKDLEKVDATVFVRIGPWPKWSDEYCDEHMPDDMMMQCLWLCS